MSLIFKTSMLCEKCFKKHAIDYDDPLHLWTIRCVTSSRWILGRSHSCDIFKDDSSFFVGTLEIVHPFYDKAKWWPISILWPPTSRKPKTTPYGHLDGRAQAGLMNSTEIPIITLTPSAHISLSEN